MQLLNNNPFALPQVLGTQQIFTNGIPTTVTSALVTNYAWPEAVAPVARARIIPKKHKIHRIFHRHKCEQILK
jgi:hypothetical protein